MAGKRKSTNIMFYLSRGVWVASWFNADGRRKSMRLPTATDKATAQEEYQRRVTAVPAPVVAPPPETCQNQKSIQTMISVFERQVMSSYRATTQAIYRQMFGLLTKASIRVVDDFRAEKLRSLKDVLITEHMGAAQQHKMLRTTRRFMRWANEVGYLMTVPKVPLPRVRKRSKGRPLTEAEFQTMLSSVDRAYCHHPDRAVGCKRLLWGLWLGGLRLSEALDLSWDDEYGFHVDWQNYKRPVFVLPPDNDKTGEDRIFPMVPEFWALISQTPEERRHGSVFRVRPTIGAGRRMSSDDVSDLVTEIGKDAKIIVGRHPDRRDSTKLKAKYASAHDLRRSFALIWARRVTQMQLGALMRHRDPSTTANYYLGVNASLLLDSVWEDSPVEPACSQAAEPNQANAEPVTQRRSPAPVFPEMPDPDEDDPVEQPERQTREPSQSTAKRGTSRSRRTSEPHDVVVERSRDRARQTEPSMAEAETTERKLMRAKEVMTTLNISRRTLNMLENSKAIRVVVLGEQKQYVKEDVMKLLDPESGLELWSPKAAADFIGGISTKTVVRMAASGKLRSAKTPKGHCRVYAADVRKLVASQSRKR